MPVLHVTYAELQYVLKAFPGSIKPVSQSVIIHPVKNTKINTQTLWSGFHGCFVTYSKDFKKYVGSGANPAGAEKSFRVMLKDFIENSDKGGRPRKHTVRFFCRLPEQAKQYLDFYCNQYGMNQGELIVELIRLHSEVIKSLDTQSA